MLNPRPLNVRPLRQPPLVCRLCQQEAEHNETLRISYCAIHGLESPLDILGSTPRRFETGRAAFVRNANPTFNLGSWAIPAG